ncbi:tetratricopeptide repeat protein [Peptoclostridium litorale]|uniref:tetratricopeptide repeat protein n=1 Tax=Peptoclostridium litorale TaxID=1557 RepID=UPI0009418F1F|nr:tetratricopeptide repeat protein [Peptoclostridium litorale]
MGKSLKAWVGIGLCFVKKGRLDIAEIYFKEALKMEPACAAANFEIGKYRFDNKKYKYSMGYFKKVLDVQPTHEMANYYAAYALVKLNEFEEAWKYINKSIELGENEDKKSLLDKINKSLKVKVSRL